MMRRPGDYSDLSEPTPQQIPLHAESEPMTYSFRILLALAFLAACSKSAGETSTPSSECRDSGDCPAGRQCEDNRCVEKQPELKSSCTMNGLGNGTCRFTNLGPEQRALCGRIVVLRSEPPTALPDYPNAAQAERFSIQALGVVASEIFCSGQVQPKETKSVDFIAPLSSLCGGAKTDVWSDLCTFSFLDDESAELALKAGEQRLQREAMEHHARICRAREDCAKRGLCISKAHSRLMSTEAVQCYADDAACAASLLCKDNGKCAAKDGACAVVSESDCARSNGCRRLGHCGIFNGVCGATQNLHCERSSLCEMGLRGRCVAEGGWCVPK